MILDLTPSWILDMTPNWEVIWLFLELFGAAIACWWIALFFLGEDQ